MFYNYLELNVSGSKLVKQMLAWKREQGDSQFVIEMDTLRQEC